MKLLNTLNTTSSASLIAGFKAIDNSGISLTVVGPKQPCNYQRTFCKKVTAWLQFNRQQTIIIKDFSDVGLPRGKEVLLVGCFKLSEIANMDQTPIGFEFLSSRIYDFKGAKTI